MYIRKLSMFILPMFVFFLPLHLISNKNPQKCTSVGTAQGTIFDTA